MNPALQQLVAYPFERLASLKSGLTPPEGLAHIPLSIGEPKHAPPPFVVAALRAAIADIGGYPATRGLPETRDAAARWLERRFGLPVGSVDAEHEVLPVNGTREALFAFVQAVVDPTRSPLVVMPNPCYQIYEGAALLAGAQPWYLDTTAANGFLPDLHSVPLHIWQRCQVLFLCSPGNPAGAVMSGDYLQQALQLAERHDFVIAADECYADIYADEQQPPSSLLRAAHDLGNSRFERCIVFHSLSKRCSVPGLRSGFVAGDARLMAQFLLYRTYHGCAMSIPVQRASIAGWNDDDYVLHNRALYREKFDRVLPILAEVLPVERPAGGFYLWQAIAGDDCQFTADLYAQQNVTVVPGSYLARASSAGNPGVGRVRISLVASVEDCVAAARRIAQFVQDRQER